MFELLKAKKALAKQIEELETEKRKAEYDKTLAVERYHSILKLLKAQTQKIEELETALALACIEYVPQHKQEAFELYKEKAKENQINWHEVLKND